MIRAPRVASGNLFASFVSEHPRLNFRAIIHGECVVLPVE
jgi:hypothetical protein